MKAWLTNTYAYTLYGVFIKSLQKIVNEFNDTMSKNENYDKNVQKKPTKIEFINSEKSLSIKKIDFNDESLMPPPSCVFINMQMRHFNLEEY